MLVKNVENQENKTATFQVEVDAAEFDKAVNAAYLREKGKINIPGFRKGKAPRAVIEGMYGAEVFYQDAMDDLAPKAFEQGLTDSGLKMVGAPSIKDVNVTEDKTLVYTFGIELYPVVTLGEYKGLTANRVVTEVTDEEIDEEVESVRKRNARMIPVEREAQMGDTANIDFDGYLEGERFEGGKAEGHELELGSGSFVPGFEEQVVGMKIGEEKDINITFPTEYVEHLAGKDVVFKVKLNGLTYPELPELDDDFAQDVSEFDTLADYRADVKSKLEAEAKNDSESSVRSSLMRSAIANMTVEIPEIMITDKMEELVRNYAANYGLANNDVPFDKLCEMMGLDNDQLDLSIRPAAEYQVRSEILLEAIAEAENIEITDDDVNAFAEKIAAGYQGVPAEQIKMYFGEKFLGDEAKKEKATAVIVDNAVIKEVTAEENAAEIAAAAKAEAETEDKAE